MFEIPSPHHSRRNAGLLRSGVRSASRRATGHEPRRRRRPPAGAAASRRADRQARVPLPFVATDFSAEIAALRGTLDQILAVTKPEDLERRIAELSQKAAAPDLWDDQDAAQAITSQLSHEIGRASCRE